MTGPEVNQALDNAFWHEIAKAKASVEKRNALDFAVQPIISKLQKNLARKERWCSVLPPPAHPDPFRQVTQPKSPWPDRLRQSNRFPMTHDSTGRK
jgi:hypothetical protein